ncbi:MAG TPA: GNAT family N-acetyltransferase [Thermoflexales bacterium]|nr:GNAT family N-acetyltransferase [Anaerolineae bacterium]HQX08805.1 GNAT family N-acetyltransferase [Thermoflexales bacterium]HQY23401.1 GNAT family N-acetyltransferase [Thermoflexales bacterium]HQZ51981.1 GNAT family N-acetyltransferase [Thermoflexales bacterium]
MTEIPLAIRRATREDLPEIVRLLADDVFGQTRERYELPLPQPYLDAFAEIDADPRHELIVVERNGRIVATMHLIELVSLTKVATRRMEVEAVRVQADLRGQRIGERMMRWAIERTREKGCGTLQLTSDARRPEAHAFYARLGFVASHVGMKLSVGH